MRLIRNASAFYFKRPCVLSEMSLRFREDKKNAEKTRKCDAVFAYSVHLSTETGSKLILLEIPFDISTEGNTFVK